MTGSAKCRDGQAGYTITELSVASAIAILLFSGMIALTRVSRDGHELVADRTASNATMRESSEDISLDLRMTNMGRMSIEPLENGNSMVTFLKALGTADGTSVYGAHTEAYGKVVPTDEVMALAPVSAIRVIDPMANDTSDALEADRIAATEQTSDATTDAEKDAAMTAMSDAMYKVDWYTCYLAVPDPDTGGRTAILIRQLLNSSFDIMRTEVIAKNLVANGGFLATEAGDSITIVIERVNSDGTTTARKFSIVPKN